MSITVKTTQNGEGPNKNNDYKHIIVAMKHKNISRKYD